MGKNENKKYYNKSIHIIENIDEIVDKSNLDNEKKILND